MTDVHATPTPPARPAAWKLAALAIAAATLAGCASKVPLDTKPPVENRSGATVAPAAAGTGGGTGAPAAQSTVTTVDLARQTAEEANRAGRVIFFDFDSFVVRDQFRPIVDAHAKALNANPQRRLSIEGHTDERGSREYNLALGQRRAEAVARSLTLLGAKESQIEAVSFGEERPAAQGSNEEAWAQNRRAELNVKP
jgi:peptidoglycan-associated lipoprotein